MLVINRETAQNKIIGRSDAYKMLPGTINMYRAPTSVYYLLGNKMSIKRQKARDSFDLTSLPPEVQKALYLSDDRSTALVGACLVEKALTELLCKVVLGSKTELASLMESPTAPLHSFSAKTRVAHAFGLISTREKHDLDLVRDVRNDFAHNILGCDFTDPVVVAHCSKFQILRSELRPVSVQKQFIQEVGILVGMLTFRCQSASPATSPAEFQVAGK